MVICCGCYVDIIRNGVNVCENCGRPFCDDCIDDHGCED